MVIGKSRSLEVRQLRKSLRKSEDGETIASGSGSPFPVVLNAPINGRITSLSAIQLDSKPTSLLFVTTDQHQYAVIGYDSQLAPHYIRTYASGSLKDEWNQLGQLSECGPLVTVDPYSRCIVLHLYDGLVTVFPIRNATMGRPNDKFLGPVFHARLEERTVLALTILHHLDPIETPPHLCILHQDSRGAQHVATHVVDLHNSQILTQANYTMMARPEQQVFSPSFYSGATVATPRVEAPLTMRSTTSPHPLASAMKHQFHPTGSVATGGDATRESLVHSARKQWKKHGSALTQNLEDLRRRDEERPGTMTARLMSAESRVDITNRKYTSYVLNVKLANNQVLQIEHRYSEFVKLNDAFRHHGVELDAEFPPKHLAGRLGNWQVAKRFAPTRHEDLINYRKVQLDVWMVAVLAKYNLGDLPHSLARLVYEFMTLSDRPPCDMDNTMALAESENSTNQPPSCFNNAAGVNYRKKNMLKWNNPISFTLGSSIRQACQIVEDFCIGSSDQSIPLDLLQAAKGLIFLTVVKAGFMVSGRIGTGLLVARVDDDTDQPQQKWSAPCALGTIGMGWGQIGK